MSTGGEFSPIDGRSSFALSPAVIITALLLIAMGALVFLHRMGPSEDPQSIVILEVTEQVESDEASMVSAGNVILYVPANSLLEDGTISIKRVPPDLVPMSNDIWTRPIVVLIEFMDAEGRPVSDFQFLNRVEVCFRLTEEEWADSTQRPTSYQVQFYPPGEELAYWDVLLMSTHSDNFQLCGLTTRLGMFALAIELQSQIPITGATQAVLPPPTSSIPHDNLEPAPTQYRERPTTTVSVPTSTSTPQPPPPTDTPLPAPTNTQPPPPPDTPRPHDPGPPTDAPNPPNPGGPPTDAPRPPDPGPPPDPGRPTDPGPPPDRGRPTDPGPPPDRGRPTDAGPPPDRGPPPGQGRP